jgi:hypothetical protein
MTEVRGEMELTFEQWMRSVDRQMAKLTGGLTSGDLPDTGYWDMWDDGVDAIDVVVEVLEEEGFFLED